MKYGTDNIEWEKSTYSDDFEGVLTARDSRQPSCQETAVLCYVRGHMVVHVQNVFLSFPPSDADLSDKNIPHLIKVRANLWACS